MTNLEELATVHLPAQGTYKFIVLPVTDGQNQTFVLVGDPSEEFHSDIYYSYCRMLPQKLRALEPLGGGRVRLTDTELYAYGYSGSYGQAPQELVENLLTPFAHEKNLTLRVEMGVGY